MGKRNNQLKMLANIAKQRLMKGEYTEPKEKSVFVPKVSSYFIKNACALKKFTAQIEYVKLQDKIDADFEKKVIELLDSDLYDLTPFSKLIDTDFYNQLDEIGKQSYVLNIAEKYNNVREKYLLKEEEAI